MKRQFPQVRMETVGSGTDDDPYQKAPVQPGRRRRPLKGGGGPGYKGTPPPNLMKGLIDKLVKSLGGKLRAIGKNWITTLLGVAAIIQALFLGDEVNTDALWAGIALILGRQAWTSSQESGIRKDVSKDLKELEAAVEEVIKKPTEILPD